SSLTNARLLHLARRDGRARGRAAHQPRVEVARARRGAVEDHLKEGRPTPGMVDTSATRAVESGMSDNQAPCVYSVGRHKAALVGT
ncbi:hypothetical protein OAO87_02840, partial [bacterium]|nr:hypothetical protein [bacterium]